MYLAVRPFADPMRVPNLWGYPHPTVFKTLKRAIATATVNFRVSEPDGRRIPVGSRGAAVGDVEQTFGGVFALDLRLLPRMWPDFEEPASDPASALDNQSTDLELEAQYRDAERQLELWALRADALKARLLAKARDQREGDAT